MANYAWWEPTVAEQLAISAIPKGDKGDKGDTGDTGAAGAAATLRVEDTTNGKTYDISSTNGVLGLTEVV